METVSSTQFFFKYNTALNISLYISKVLASVLNIKDNKMQNLFGWMIQVRNVRKISQHIEIISNGVILKELQRVKIWVGSWDVVFRRKKSLIIIWNLLETKLIIFLSLCC